MRRLLQVLALLVLLASAGDALAQGYDARGMAMGGVSLNQNSGRLSRINPAYKAVPPRISDDSFTVPIPIGIIQFIQYFPELDPDSEDFSLVQIINFASNIPWAWEFQQPPDPKEGAEIWLSEDELIIDLRDGQQLIPRNGYSTGGLGNPFDLGFQVGLGGRAGLLHFSIARPFLHSEVALELDDNLVGVLADAEPVEPSTDYSANVKALMQAGISSGVTWALPIFSEGAGGTDGDGGGLWFGTGYRRYFGGGYVGVNGDVTLHSGDPIFGSAGADTFGVGFDAAYLRAWPNNWDTVGYGNAIDVGAVWRQGKIEVGFGVADILADLTWGNTTIDRTYLDEDFNTVVTENVAEGATTVLDIPASWMGNLTWYGEKLVVGLNAVEQPGGLSLHGGAEIWAVEWLALRGGISRDQREELQGGWGVGLKFGAVGVDVGFQTHFLGLTEERGISMGLGVTVY